MSDCPAGCAWEYDKNRHPAAAYPTPESFLPLVYDDGALRRARLQDEITASEVRAVATAAHLMFEHPDHATVRAYREAVEAGT